MTILLQITIQQVTSHGRALLEALQPRYYTENIQELYRECANIVQNTYMFMDICKDTKSRIETNRR